MSKFWTVLFLSVVSVNVSALPSYSGTINNLLTGKVYQGNVFIQLDGAKNGTSDCQTHPHYDFAFDPTTDEGKVYLSLILTAHSTQKEVTITGYDTCLTRGGIQDLRSIQLKK
jgi:hypothetical protein